MRITVDLDETHLDSLQRETGARKKSRAVRQAVERYLEGLARQRFLRRVLAGETDYSLTNEQVEALGKHDAP